MSNEVLQAQHSSTPEGLIRTALCGPWASPDQNKHLCMGQFLQLLFKWKTHLWASLHKIFFSMIRWHKAALNVLFIIYLKGQNLQQHYQIYRNVNVSHKELTHSYSTTLIYYLKQQPSVYCNIYFCLRREKKTIMCQIFYVARFLPIPEIIFNSVWHTVFITTSLLLA